MLPNFLIIGTAKSGTTTVARQLCKHPNVGFASAAEPNFFAFDQSYARGITHYESFFSHCTDKIVIGEKSWRYSVDALYPKARDRIAEHLPNARLLYIVRHPLARAESLWVECLSSGADFVSTDFNRAVRDNILFVNSSRYWAQLNRYRDYFSDDRILVLFHEDLACRQRDVFAALLAFLGVECPIDSSFKEVRENISEGKFGDNALLAVARRMPGFASSRDAAPQIVRRGLRRVFKRRLDRPTWDDDTRHWFLDQVYEDCTYLLSHAKKPSDYWIYD